MRHAWLPLIWIALASPAVAGDPPGAGACPIELEAWRADWPMLFPSCPVAVPVASWGGLCAQGRGCMKPCGEDDSFDGHVTETTSLAYDPQGRLARSVTTTGAPSVGTYAYDDAGHLVADELTSDVRSSKSEYKLRDGRTVGEYRSAKTDDKTRAPHLENQYAYDPSGRLSTTENDETVQTFEYEHGRIVRERRHEKGDGGSWVEFVSTYQYGKTGRLEHVIEKVGKTHFVGAAPKEAIPTSSFDLDYDAHGRVHTLAMHSADSGSVTTFGYDDQDRLVDEQRQEVKPGGKPGSLTRRQYRYSCAK